jgi:YidC/Oxa1 family membrane protein insertase
MLRTDLRHDICPDINPAGTPNPQPCGAGGEASFFFIHDLTNKATGVPLVILIVLYVASQLFSTLLMSTTTDKTQRLIFLGLPFLFVTFVFRFPAGLLVYWITTNVWTIVQQAIIRKRIGPLRPPTPEGESPPSLMDSLRQLGSGGATPATAGADAPAKRPAPARAQKDRALAPAGGSQPKGRPTGRPPAPPRKKKKRSGRRR